MKHTELKKTAAALMAILTVSAFSADAIAAAKTTSKTADTSSFSMRLYYPEVSGKYSNGKAVISWDKVPNASKYYIYRSENGGKFKFIKTVSKLTFTDSSVKSGNTYEYKVYGVCRRDHKTYYSSPSEVVAFEIDSKGDASIDVYDVPFDYGKPDRKNVTDDEDEEEEEWVEEEEWEDDYDYDEYEEYEEEEYAEDVSLGAGVDYEPAVTTAAASTNGSEKEEEEPSKYYYGGNDTITAGTLTAGRIDDKKKYNDFIKAVGEMRENEDSDWYDSTYLFNWTDPLDRYTINVTNGKENIEGATAELLDAKGKPVFSAVTDNKGRAYLFPGVSTGEAVTIRVTSPDGKSTYKKELSKMKGNTLKVTFAKASNSEKKLDIMFMVDTTGSMSDELEYLQAEIDDVIGRVAKGNDNISIRTSVNFYRDLGDEYVVRSFRFRNNVDTCKKSLSEQRATGGGDFPEAVHTALDVAINKHAWDEDSTKIMFLVLDAPPHKEVEKEYTQAILDAARKGIRIIPVASSGIDTGSEYILRSAATITGGTYIYLTDDSGVGLSHEKPHTDSLEVRKLNDLMVNVIDEYIAD